MTSNKGANGIPRDGGKSRAFWRLDLGAFTYKRFDWIL